MKHFSRPCRKTISSRGLALALACSAVCMVYSASAQTAGLAPSALQLPSPLLSSPVLSSPAPRASAQGYLGVLVGDVDTDTATRLKLKEARGAVVTLIDHDAPAAQAGVRVNDVVLEINGQAIGGAEQFTRILREMPAGRTISMIVCRDGAPHTVTVELADRKKMEHDVWKNLDTGADASGSAPVLGILPGASGDVPSGGFHNPFGGSALNVGAMVEPLAAQMAEYLGIQSGLMVKQVARKSEAANAGLKAFDIILKVGAESIATTADWDRALRANRNKTVQITVLRDRRQQVITLQVDSKRHRSALQQPPQAQQAEGLAPSA